jgi:hypothetical protein
VSNASVVGRVQCGPADELLSLTYFTSDTEIRTYNNVLQMTASGQTTQYTFPSAGLNNGKIQYRKDMTSGEEVQYAYNELNRLVSASTTAASDAVTTTISR